MLRISTDISTNATLITEEVVNVLNKFAGGTQGPIDSFEKEDEYIRYSIIGKALLQA